MIFFIIWISSVTVVSAESSLVGHYDFNGNAIDDTGNGHNGVTINNPVPVNDRHGKTNGAYYFDGQASYISIADHPDLKSPAVTLAAWVKVLQFGPDRVGFIFFKQNSRNNYFEGYTTCVDYPNQAFSGAASSLDGTQRGVNTNLIDLDKWYFVTFTADNQSLKIYLDGELQNSTETGYPLNYGDFPLYIGGQGQEYSFSGIIDEAWIYNRTLSQEEILFLYQSELSDVNIYPTVVTATPGMKIHLYGPSFDPGLQAHLSKNGTIVASAGSIVYASPTMIVTSFDLSTVPLGTYDLVLQSPDNSMKTYYSAIQLRALPNGVIYLEEDFVISKGLTTTIPIDIGSQRDVFVTLQKYGFTGDSHTNWQGMVSIQREGVPVVTDSSFKDQIVHIPNPSPGNYTVSVTAGAEGGQAILTVYDQLPILTPGEWVVDTIHRPYGSTFRQIELPDGVDTLTFNAQAMGIQSRFLIYHGQWGTGQQWISSGGPDASLTIPNPPAGLYIIEFLDTQMITGTDQARDVMLRASTTASVEPPPGYLPIISSISPMKGGNAGNVTITIKGGWLDANASVMLVRNGYPDILAERITGTETKSEIDATFNLTGKGIGDWDLTVINPDGQLATSPSPFSVEQGGKAELKIDLIGRDKVRSGRDSQIILKVENLGNQDANGVILGVVQSGSPNTNVELNSANLLQMTGVLYSGFHQTVPAGSAVFVGINVPGLAECAQLFGLLDMLRKDPDDDDEDPQVDIFEFEVVPDSEHSIDPIDPCSLVLKRARELENNIRDCELMIRVIEELCLEPNPPSDCDRALLKYQVDINEYTAELTNLHSAFPDCFSDTPTPTPADESSQNSGILSTSKMICGVQSVDPEDKYGPTGYDLAGTTDNEKHRFISLNQTVNYKVDFWNAENATANVCDVTAFDNLDSDLDRSTFGFTEVGFSDWTIPLEGDQYFNVYVDPRPDIDLIVNIEGQFDPTTGNVSITYHSLDPVTLQTPDDPTAGFLPPISTTGQEVGWFSFTVDPKLELETGTIIENQAFVNFDYTQFMPAPAAHPWKNTIDAEKPTSRVSASILNGTQILLNWSGVDDTGGSGIANYDIYVTNSSSSMTPLMKGTAITQGVLEAVANETYSFYCIARDNAGNIEDAKPSPDTTITVPGALALQALPGTTKPPIDLNADGKYEDVNGNGRADFADVVLYFNQMTWIADHEPVAAFDYNGNGRIDFADVVWLFNNL